MKTISICLLVALLPWAYGAKFVGISGASPIEESQDSESKRKTVGLENAEKFFLPIPVKKPLHHKPDHPDDHHEPDHHEPDHHQEDHHDVDPHKPDDHDVPDGHEHHDGHKPNLHLKPDVPHKPFFKPELFFSPFLPFLQNSLKPFSHAEDAHDHDSHKPDHPHGDDTHHVKPDHHDDHHSHGSDHHVDSHSQGPDHHLEDHGDKPIVKPSFAVFHGLEDHKQEFFESWFKFWSHFVSSFKPPFHTGRPLEVHHYHHYVLPTPPDHVEVGNHPVPVQHPEDHPSETYHVGYPPGGFHYDIHHIPPQFYPNPHFSGFPPQGFPYFPQRPHPPIPQIPDHHFLPQPFKGPDDPNYSPDKKKNEVPSKNELSDPNSDVESSEDSSNTTPRSAENHYTIGYYHYNPSPLPQYLTTTETSHKPDGHHASPHEEDDHHNHETQQKPEPPYSSFSQIFPQIFWPFTAKPSAKRAKKDKKKEKSQ